MNCLGNNTHTCFNMIKQLRIFFSSYKATLRWKLRNTIGLKSVFPAVRPELTKNEQQLRCFTGKASLCSSIIHEFNSEHSCVLFFPPSALVQKGCVCACVCVCAQYTAVYMPTDPIWCYNSWPRHCTKWTKLPTVPFINHPSHSWPLSQWWGDEANCQGEEWKDSLLDRHVQDLEGLDGDWTVQAPVWKKRCLLTPTVLTWRHHGRCDAATWNRWTRNTV